MNKKLERYRQLRDKKKARLEKAQKDMDRLEQMVQDEENTQIVAAVRSYSLTPEELEAFLKERRMTGLLLLKIRRKRTMKLEKQACMLALAAILLLIVGAFVVGFPAGATLAEETDIDLNAFEGSVILDDPVYFQEATPDEPEVKPTQQPTIEPTQAPGEQPTVEPTHEPTAEPAADAKFTVQITPPTGWRNTASAQACVDIADENGTGFKQVKVSTGGAGWMDVTEQAESGSFDLDVYDNGTLTDARHRPAGRLPRRNGEDHVL